MKTRLLALAACMLAAAAAHPQNRAQNPAEDQVIRIGTKLVQLDAVVVDKTGKIVKGLGQDDFELYEGGKKQQISFFEFVEAGGLGQSGRPGQEHPAPPKPAEPSRQGPGEGDVRRIFAFVIDDLTIRNDDLFFVRQMLTNFLDNRMQPTDLVAIVRTVGGKGLLQTFTTDKDLLRRAIASLTVANHPFSAFDNPDAQDAEAFAVASGASSGAQDATLSGNAVDITSSQDDTNKALRAYMALGTASFVIDSMKELPGRKAMVLVSGGLPILGFGAGSVAGDVSYFLNRLADHATRAGVVINTLDIRGLSAQVGVAHFEDTPGRSALGAGSASVGFGRTVDESQFGHSNPFDVADAHMGLRQLSSVTGGQAILNRNDFNAGLDRILETSDAYYLLAYTPSDANFKNDFRKVAIKVKGAYKVYSRSGYFAREERPAGAPTTKQDQLLAAIKSPLARKDVGLDAEVLYKAAAMDKGAIGIDLVIDPKKISFEQSEAKKTADVDVAGFVFDELGKLRGGFSQTLNLNVSPEEYNQIMTGGLTYTQNTELPAGIYQIRLAARDNKTGALGTVSRYLEVPDLSKGRFTASSVMLGTAPVGEMKPGEPTPISANRRIPKNSDLRYAVFIYNARVKDDKPLVRAQMVISQGGQVIYKGAEEPVPFSGGSAAQLVRVGQLGLSRVKPGRYTISILITDALADKKAQTLTRSSVFEVVE